MIGISIIKISKAHQLFEEILTREQNFHQLFEEMPSREQNYHQLFEEMPSRKQCLFEEGI